MLTKKNRIDIIQSGKSSNTFGTTQFKLTAVIIIELANKKIKHLLANYEETIFYDYKEKFLMQTNGRQIFLKLLQCGSFLLEDFYDSSLQHDDEEQGNF